MLATSQTYKGIVAGSVPFDFEWKVKVNNTEYDSRYIVKEGGSSGSAPRLVRQAFPSGEPTTGNCMASEFSVVLRVPSLLIPRKATIKPYFRVVDAEGTVSDWYQAGEFFIDKRSADEGTDTTRLTCYDAMLKADGPSGNTYYDLTSITSWPASASAVVTEIAGLIGVSIDSRTSLQSGFYVDDPGDYTMREVLGFIAAEHCANWVITHEGKLRLLPLVGASTDTFALAESSVALDVVPLLPTWTKATLVKDNKTSYSAGYSSGLELSADDPWATQAKANYVRSVIGGTEYQPFTATDAFVDPAAELGDGITFTSAGESLASNIWSMDLSCDEYSVSTVSASGGDELNHEYPYIPVTRRRQRRAEFQIEELEEQLEEVEEEIPEQIEEMVSQVFLKVAELDFSGWDSGYFSETLEDETVNGFLVDFDASGKPIKVTDGEGFETDVIWS